MANQPTEYHRYISTERRDLMRIGNPSGMGVSQGYPLFERRGSTGKPRIIGFASTDLKYLNLFVTDEINPKIQQGSNSFQQIFEGDFKTMNDLLEGTRFFNIRFMLQIRNNYSINEFLSVLDV